MRAGAASIARRHRARRVPARPTKLRVGSRGNDRANRSPTRPERGWRGEPLHFVREGRAHGGARGRAPRPPGCPLGHSGELRFRQAPSRRDDPTAPRKLQTRQTRAAPPCIWPLLRASDAMSLPPHYHFPCSSIRTNGGWATSRSGTTASSSTRRAGQALASVSGCTTACASTAPRRQTSTCASMRHAGTSPLRILSHIISRYVGTGDIIPRLNIAASCPYHLQCVSTLSPSLSRFSLSP